MHCWSACNGRSCWCLLSTKVERNAGSAHHQLVIGCACSDQPERFDMLMDIEMPDLTAELQQQAEADELETQADQHAGEQDEEILAPPAPLTPPTPGEKDQMGADAGAMNIIEVTPEAEEGQQLQRAAQVCILIL